MTATVQADVAGFEDLATQLISRRDNNGKIPEAKLEKAEIPTREEQGAEQDVKRSSFRKGERSFDIDDDAEIEFMADKNPVKMKLSELKDRAAGDVAIKNRLHSLAEEKKKVQGTLKEFSKIAEKDPLKALEFISKQVNEAGTEFEYDKYLNALANQAEKLARMDEKERRAHQAEKRLEEVEGDLSQREVEDLVRHSAQASRERLGIGESQFNQAARMVMENSVLMESIETDEEFFGTVEEMVVKAQQQKRVEQAISKVDPSEINNSDLIIELAEIVEDLLPDGTDSDIQEIVAEVLKPKIKGKVEQRLSDRQRTSMPIEDLRSQGASDFHLLVEQLKEKRLDKPRR